MKLDGVDVAGWPTHRIARHGVGIVFQHARPLHRQTILEHIQLALLPDNLLMLRDRTRRDPPGARKSPPASACRG